MRDENIELDAMANQADRAGIGRPGYVPLPVSGAIPVSRALHVTRGPAVVATPVAARARSPLGPILAGLCCLGLILFLIAATIVLSLIPIYTPTRNLETGVAQESEPIDVPIDDNAVVNTGPLNAQQRILLQNNLQRQLNSNPQTSDAVVQVVSANAQAPSSGRKRQIIRAILIRTVVIIFFRRRGRFLVLVRATLRAFRINAALANQLQALAPPTTTTTARTTTTAVTTANTTSTNRTRILARRSLTEGGAPVGLYVDSNQIASVKGNVISVSFYVDRSCALGKLEFAAFELITRDVGANTAELVLTARSGVLTVLSEKYLKSQMNHITIRLCAGDAVADVINGDCQGLQFPVLAHQYLGIYSNTCRFGYAAPPSNPVLATTWEVSGKADPFATPYQKISYVPSKYIVLQSVVIESPVTDEQNGGNQEVIGTGSSPRVLFVGSFPPRRCGLATFLDDVTDNYPGPYSVVAVDENTDSAAQRVYPEKVIYRLNETNRDAYYSVAELANSEAYDVVNIQHEYALYGGMLGEYIVGMIGAIQKPVITTMHTIIADPNSYYRSITRALCSTSTRVIVLSNQGRDLLISIYGVDADKVVVVPHGVPDVDFSLSLTSAKKKLGFAADIPIITTFGLVHRNKNIQLGIKAMDQVVKEIPKALYLVIGQTHPAIQSSEGESYRHELQHNVTALELTNNVKFVDKYVTDNELLDYLAATDIYLTPYAREDQYVSGTLSWAVGVGKAVISTPYWYAKELLADGRGFIVPFDDDYALSKLMVNLIQDDDKRNAAREAAYAYGRQMTWTSVGKQLRQMFSKLIAAA